MPRPGTKQSTVKPASEQAIIPTNLTEYNNFKTMRYAVCTGVVLSRVFNIQSLTKFLQLEDKIFLEG